MKTISTLILMCFGILICHGQNQLKLSIKKGSDTPNYETEHLYLLELSNPTSVASSVNISLKNVECSNVKKADQVEFNQTLLDKNKQSRVQQIVVQPGKTVEFYVQLTRPNGARLNTWNCTEIIATSNDGRSLSNAVAIESLIPNPNNNN
ncbi:MAG: hypothetical protein R2797_08060 [Gelidibacter sp.]